MKIIMNIECENCGNRVELPLVKTTSENQGRVYECSTSITDSINGKDLAGIKENDFFHARQSCPDEIDLRCKQCGHSHTLTT